MGQAVPEEAVKQAMAFGFCAVPPGAPNAEGLREAGKPVMAQRPPPPTPTPTPAAAIRGAPVSLPWRETEQGCLSGAEGVEVPGGAAADAAGEAKGRAGKEEAEKPTAAEKEGSEEADKQGRRQALRQRMWWNKQEKTMLTVFKI